MKRILPAILSVILLYSVPLKAADDVIGKIVRREGVTRKSNLNCQDNGCDNQVIRRGDRIRTGPDSKVQVLLNDGTGIIIYERSDVYFNDVIRPGRKKPTEIYTEYGKYKIIQNNSFLETSLVIKTGNSLVKSVNATFCIIAALNETAIFVYSGEAGFASIENSISNAYIIKEGEESLIRAGSRPSVPVKVKTSMQGSWLSRHVISKNKKYILRSSIEKGPLDWPFTEKD